MATERASANSAWLWKASGTASGSTPKSETAPTTARNGSSRPRCKRLRTDYVDLLFVHSLDTEDQREQIMQAESVLKAIEEYRRAGNVRYIGVSGHWVKDVMLRILGEYKFDAVLFPVGLFNIAYNYSFLDTVLPFARSKEMAVLGMKVYGAGRVKQAASIAPYLRYSHPAGHRYRHHRHGQHRAPGRDDPYPEERSRAALRGGGAGPDCRKPSPSRRSGTSMSSVGSRATRSPDPRERNEYCV